MPQFRFTVADAAARLPEQTATQLRFATLFERGTLAVEFYAPQGRDAQQPHTRDELYVIVSGSGEFVNGDERQPFGPGDALFVSAGVTHRFEHFSDDFQTWVFFYGPEGGELPAEA